MKNSLLSLRDVVDIKDAWLRRPRDKKDIVIITGDMINRAGNKIPVKLEAEVANGHGLHFIREILGRSDFKSVDMVIKVRDD